MREFQESTSDAELDRLVDGEMMLAEQRAMLARLENETDGWRRLALAFLEAQTLRQVCPGLLTDGPAVSAPMASPSVIIRPTRRTWRDAVLALSVACVAFVLGTWSNRPADDSGSRSVAVTAPQPADAPSTTVDRLRVMFPEGPGQWSAPVELPVVDESDRRAQVWLTDQAVWPVAFQEALREAGRQVSEERSWMEVDLQDGRRGYVPVSELVVSANVPLSYP